MKIGYITKEDPNDIGAYSGTHFSMLKALQREFEEVVVLGPLDHWYKNIAKLNGKIRTFGSNKVYKFQYDIELAKIHSGLLERRIQSEKPDVLLGSLVTPEVAYLNTDVPFYLTTDATFPRLNELHKSHTNLYYKSFKNAKFLENMAFQKAQGLVLPLNWLKESAIKEYNVSEEKINVISYGSNIPNQQSESEIHKIIEQRASSQKIELLFVGINWEQKGGPEAVTIIEELNNLGIDSTLNIVGCSPNLNSEKVRVHGFLNKQIPKELEQLINLYKKVAFFVLPTKAECVGMSFIEAASFGLPAIGTTVGGVPEAINHQKTGWTFARDASPSEIAQEISMVWNDKSQYEKMSVAAHQKYSNQMNWETWGKNFKKIIASDFNL